MKNLLDYQRRLAQYRILAKALDRTDYTARRRLCTELDDMLHEMKDEVIERLIKERLSNSDLMMH